MTLNTLGTENRTYAPPDHAIPQSCYTNTLKILWLTFNLLIVLYNYFLTYRIHIVITNLTRHSCYKRTYTIYPLAVLNFHKIFKKRSFLLHVTKNSDSNISSIGSAIIIFVWTLGVLPFRARFHRRSSMSTTKYNVAMFQKMFVFGDKFLSIMSHCKSNATDVHRLLSCVL